MIDLRPLPTSKDGDVDPLYQRWKLADMRAKENLRGKREGRDVLAYLTSQQLLRYPFLFRGFTPQQRP